MHCLKNKRENMGKLKKFLPFLLLSFFVIVRFYNLGFKEIQMWDEALYAVRAKAIYYFNCWLDQTDYAEGGLYSSSHPPLYIWLTALLYKLFTINEFTSRFFSALFSSLCLVLTYLLIKKFFNRKSALISIPFLGSIYLFNFYSRQGQLDIAYIFFITLSIYFYLEFLNGGKKRNILISGVSFGFALMTKIIVGFFAIITIFIFLFIELVRKNVKFKEVLSQIATLTLTGLILSLPWHIFMLKIHAGNFINTFFKFHIIERLSEGVEGNIPELGYFYILNQLVVQFPPVVLVFFDLFESLKKLKTADSKKLLLQSWFWTTFLITSISKTKIPTYALPSFIPAVIISSVYIVELTERKQNSLALSTVLISIIWSSSQNLRNGVKEFFKFHISNFSITQTALFLISLVISPFLVSIVKSKVKSLNDFILSITLLISTLVVFKTIIFTDYERFNDGAEKVANFIDNSNYQTLFYLYTPHSTEGMNPQLTFYSFKKLSHSIKWIEIKRSNFNEIANQLSKTKDALVLIEKTAKDKSERKEEFENVKKILNQFNFAEILITKRYSLFVRKL
jgi:4-amino-4-deoxy-L-arabinose transferase-like glycosyltransferase